MTRNLDFFSAPYGTATHSPDQRSVTVKDMINKAKYIVIDNTSVKSGASETENREQGQNSKKKYLSLRR